jgi:hypothetical protein
MSLLPARCMMCGTCSPIAELVKLAQMGPAYSAETYYECEDPFDCARRRQMHMGPLPCVPPDFHVIRPIVVSFSLDELRKLQPAPPPAG